MRAIRIHSRGGPDHLVYEDAPQPQLSELASKPRSLDHAQAAAVPLAAPTAWQAFFEHASLVAGQTVLIHRSTGGVGVFAVQFASWAGAQVIATASASNRDFLRELGANEIIDYTTTRFEEVVYGVDLVFDLVGGDTLQRSWQVVKLQESLSLLSVHNPLLQRRGLISKGNECYE